MRMAIVSDTHGRYGLAVKALDAKGHFQYIVHLGDTVADAEMIEVATASRLIKISGNCDPSGHPATRLIFISGKRLLATHGDIFAVKSGLEDLYEQARDNEADIVLYGHTHIPFINDLNGILFINPGTFTSPEPTFAILHIDGHAAHAEIVDVNMLDLH